MHKTMYKIGKASEEEHLALDFQDGRLRTAEERIEMGFVSLNLPVIDDAPYRIFDKMEKYRQWPETALLRYLGYYQK